MSCSLSRYSSSALADSNKHTFFDLNVCSANSECNISWVPHMELAAFHFPRDLQCSLIMLQSPRKNGQHQQLDQTSVYDGMKNPEEGEIVSIDADTEQEELRKYGIPNSFILSRRWLYGVVMGLNQYHFDNKAGFLDYSVLPMFVLPSTANYAHCMNITGYPTKLPAMLNDLDNSSHINEEGPQELGFYHQGQLHKVYFAPQEHEERLVPVLQPVYKKKLKGIRFSGRANQTPRTGYAAEDCLLSTAQVQMNALATAISLLFGVSVGVFMGDQSLTPSKLLKAVDHVQSISQEGSSFFTTFVRQQPELAGLDTKRGPFSPHGISYDVIIVHDIDNVPVETQQVLVSLSQSGTAAIGSFTATRTSKDAQRVIGIRTGYSNQTQFSIDTSGQRIEIRTKPSAGHFPNMYSLVPGIVPELDALFGTSLSPSEDLFTQLDLFNQKHFDVFHPAIALLGSNILSADKMHLHFEPHHEMDLKIQRPDVLPHDLHTVHTLGAAHLQAYVTDELKKLDVVTQHSNSKKFLEPVFDPAYPGIVGLQWCDGASVTEHPDKGDSLKLHAVAKTFLRVDLPQRAPLLPCSQLQGVVARTLGQVFCSPHIELMALQHADKLRGISSSPLLHHNSAAKNVVETCKLLAMLHGRDYVTQEDLALGLVYALSTLQISKNERASPYNANAHLAVHVATLSSRELCQTCNGLKQKKLTDNSSNSTTNQDMLLAPQSFSAQVQPVLSNDEKMLELDAGKLGSKPKVNFHQGTKQGDMHDTRTHNRSADLAVCSCYTLSTQGSSVGKHTDFGSVLVDPVHSDFSSMYYFDGATNTQPATKNQSHLNHHSGKHYVQLTSYADIGSQLDTCISDAPNDGHRSIFVENPDDSSDNDDEDNLPQELSSHASAEHNSFADQLASKGQRLDKQRSSNNISNTTTTEVSITLPNPKRSTINYIPVASIDGTLNLPQFDAVHSRHQERMQSMRQELAKLQESLVFIKHISKNENDIAVMNSLAKQIELFQKTIHDLSPEDLWKLYTVQGVNTVVPHPSRHLDHNISADRELSAENPIFTNTRLFVKYQAAFTRAFVTLYVSNIKATTHHVAEKTT